MELRWDTGREIRKALSQSVSELTVTESWVSELVDMVEKVIDDVDRLKQDNSILLGTIKILSRES